MRAGGIQLDGTDIRELSIADLRENIAIVSQSPILFNDTVLANIKLGRPEASVEEIKQAAKDAHAEEFIMQLPQQYDTVLGDKGDRLSGGQKQRIALARAFLKNAPILILDEATSALDNQSEVMIKQALEVLVKGKTVFMIAHRLSTIRNAERIFVFSAGRIVGQGTHEELLKNSPEYRELVDANQA